MATVEHKPGTDTSQNGGPGAGTLAVDNPATGETIAHVPDLDAGQVEALVMRARAAQPAWEALGYEGRAEVMDGARRWLVKNRERMTRTIMEECGKTAEDAQIGEIWYIADALGFWSKNASKFLADERVRPHSPLLFGKKLVTRYRPYGVVGVIAPWNYPFGLGFGDSIPALMAGNTVVIKPSEHTPLSILLMQEGMKAAGAPEDAFLVATGYGATGAALVDHADMIMFTGSAATGKRVMKQAAERLIPVSLELGGKDPMIVLRDADVDRAANSAVQWAFSNSGQICMSFERIYVEEPIYDEFVRKVVETSRKLRQGAPGEPGSVDVGAMTMPDQIDIVDRHVRDAVDKGAQVLVGGHRKDDGPGRYFEPTVLTGVDHTMAIMREETFGPTLPIMKVRDAEEALELANDTTYGLNSAVFTKDVQKGEQLARRLTAGNSCVNDGLLNYAALELPFGGAGESGLGVRHSAKGIQKYCQTQSILITRFGLKREPYFFPYSKRAAKILDRLNVWAYGREKKKPRRRR